MRKTHSNSHLQLKLHFKDLTAVTTPPILVLSDFSKNFVIECDASGDGVRVVLMQERQPLAYLSHALKGISMQLSTYKCELLALVLAVKKWRPYLLGNLFVIKIDH